MALETVSLKSRFKDCGSSFNFVLEGVFESFLIKFFVACCSINFLTVVFLTGSVFLKFPGLTFDLLSREGLKGVFFSIANVFFPTLVREERLIFFYLFVEIV